MSKSVDKRLNDIAILWSLWELKASLGGESSALFTIISLSSISILALHFLSSVAIASPRLLSLIFSLEVFKNFAPCFRVAKVMSIGPKSIQLDISISQKPSLSLSKSVL